MHVPFTTVFSGKAVSNVFIHCGILAEFAERKAESVGYY
jgi:hypothetical protein